MKNFTLLLCLPLLPFFAFGQKHDYNWVFGSPTINDEPYNGSILMNFNTDPVGILELPNQHLNFDLAQSSFSNGAGELLFYTNGIGVEGANGVMLENGDSLNPGISIDWYYETGARCYNCAFFVEAPWDENLVLLLHSGADFYVGTTGHVQNTFYYSLIDRTANGGAGKVVQKNVPIISGIFTPFGATRHANGRDWWVLFQEKTGKKFYKILVDPTGVHVQGSQVFEEIIPVDHPQNDNPYIFSPDGNKLAFCSKFTGVHIFDFDRCTGELSNLVYIPITVAFTDIGYGTPLAFSPNSRFLYYATHKEVRQLDLWKTDIAASEDTVAVYDGYTNIYGQPALFGYMQLGPDGKIYGISSGLHAYIVQQPNLEGIACQVAQHAIQFPYFGFPLYYFPNYRLGPMDGSPCDTLGLDNLPLAGFQCEADSLEPLQFTFTDNSFYEPAEWLWDFGDNSTSQDTSTAHTFPASGVYEVCLTVGNQYGDDTFCKEVYVGVSGTSTMTGDGRVYGLYPNPSTGMFTLLFPASESVRQVEVFYITGQLLKRIVVQNTALKQQIDLQGLNNGIYLLRVTEGGRTVLSQRVSIIH
ncbi:MAG: T9SS type A sorting domain-containing protein [Bacteroidetes bacterium]|nr:T9SS type A sorting domain-containing protein [Bacteroidota bacterium]